MRPRRARLSVLAPAPTHLRRPAGGTQARTWTAPTSRTSCTRWAPTPRRRRREVPSLLVVPRPAVYRGRVQHGRGGRQFCRGASGTPSPRDSAPAPAVTRPAQVAKLITRMYDECRAGDLAEVTRFLAAKEESTAKFLVRPSPQPGRVHQGPRGPLPAAPGSEPCNEAPTPAPCACPHPATSGVAPTQGLPPPRMSSPSPPPAEAGDAAGAAAEAACLEQSAPAPAPRQEPDEDGWVTAAPKKRRGRKKNKAQQQHPPPGSDA